jgi:nucleotide-binding universal stress UspA family protein
LSINKTKAGVIVQILEAERVAQQIVSIKKILVAVDLSRHSEDTAVYAAGIASQFGASLTIVHVYEPVPLSEYTCECTFTLLDDQRDCLQKLLEGITKKIRQLGVSSDSFFLIGEPAGKITALAREIDADLIVTASHHLTFLGRLFNLDKAPQIMHQAPCPVLVYHEKKA